MKISILFKTAAKALLNQRVRSSLTISGITVGVAAIVITFSIGRGAEDKVKASIEAMGEGTVMIIPGDVMGPGGARSSLAKNVRLTVDDVRAIQKQVPEIREISRGTYGYLIVERGKNAVKEELVGADENMFKIFRLSKIAYGMPFTKEHDRSRLNVAVIGSAVVKDLFLTESPINKTILIKGLPFTVIGVMEESPNYFSTQDPNAHVFIPFLTAKKLFKKQDETDEDLGYIAFVLYSGVPAAPVVRRVKRVLRFCHNIAPGDPDDFILVDQESIAETAAKAGNVVKLFGLIAASISLLVGGIGIMNIMLVSVQERMEEIGLRISLGATQRLIRLQFLFESSVMCALGGFLGILVALIGQIIIDSYTSLPSVMEIMPPIVALLATICVGIFFGYYPARKASLLNPLDVLLGR